MSPITATTTEFNPAIEDWQGPFGLPEFAAIADADFEAAFAAALPVHLAEINAIADNPEAPNFENTIVALERAGNLLNRAASIFWNLSGATPMTRFRHWSGNCRPRCRGIPRRFP